MKAVYKSCINGFLPSFLPSFSLSPLSILPPSSFPSLLKKRMFVKRGEKKGRCQDIAARNRQHVCVKDVMGLLLLLLFLSFRAYIQIPEYLGQLELVL